MSRPDDAFSSCEAQRDACSKFLASRRPELWLPVGGVFEDAGASGATLDRPGLTELLERLERGDIGRLVVHRFDRLTRNFRDWLKLVRFFEEHDVKLAVVSGDLHAGELASSDLMLNTLASFAEFEREMIRDRLADARAARRRRGLRSAGRVPFGYRSDPRTRQLVPAEAEAAVVRRFFEMAAAGDRPATIAAWAKGIAENDEELAATGPRQWSSRTVLRALRNPAYAGDLAGEGERVEGAHPAIVTRDVFDAVQAAISRRQTRAPSVRPDDATRDDPFLLRGLVKCAACGRWMTTSASTALRGAARRSRGRLPDPPRYYRCRGGARPCQGSQVAARQLEEEVVRWLSAPPGGVLADDVFERVTTWMSTWSLLWPRNRRRLLRVLIDEVRWDGAALAFTVVLNATENAPRSDQGS